MKDLTGQRFGRWEVLRLSELRQEKRQAIPYWLCQCSCGTTRPVRGAVLKAGNSTSCGCYQRERASAAATTHGAARVGKKTPTYRVWRNMICRCYEPAHLDFGRYGGRGITVCERWRHNFPNFLADMGEKPDEHSIERLDVDAGYLPENCTWIPVKHQAINRSSTVWVEHNGERMPMKHYAALMGVSYGALGKRVKRGQSAADAAAALMA